MDNYRPLSAREIQQLESQGCRADNWDNVQVKDGFMPERVEQVRFYGEIRLGVFRKVFEPVKGVFRPSGIRRAELHHVTVGDDCLIEDVHGYIAFYIIKSGAYLSDLGVVTMEGTSTFGLGTQVNILSEASDCFQIRLHHWLTAQEICLHLLLRSDERKVLSDLLEKEIAPYRSSYGVVGMDAVICHTRCLKNVYVGPSANISFADCLEDCFLSSVLEAPVRIGNGVICRRSVFLEGSEVLDGAKVSECLVGQAVHVGKGFSAESSLFFANSYMDNGEACAVCAGPFTVSHHKSTLLIGCLCSFLNAGSGTNMSNHMYKLGPLHYGKLERGCKTASGAHLVWEGHVGAFSMVMGKYDHHADLSCFPFSYLFHADGKSSLVPGVNFATVGTYRDLHKWPLRDKRCKDVRRLDTITTYGALNPRIVNQIREGRRRLEQLLQEQGDACTMYKLSGQVGLSAKALHRGIALYRRMEQLFVAASVTSMESFSGDKAAQEKEERWYDLLGLLLPESAWQALKLDLLRGDIASFLQLTERFQEESRKYASRVEYYTRTTYSCFEVLEALKAYPANLDEYYRALCEDAAKEKGLVDARLFPLFDKLAADLQNESMEALKKAKEKVSSLVGRRD